MYPVTNNPQLSFSLGRLRRNISLFRSLSDDIFGRERYEVYFPSKVAPWPSLVQTIASCGLGLEAVHQQAATEAMALASGRVILGGNAKTPALIRSGLRQLGWRFISCESPEEAATVHRLAGSVGAKQEILLRLKVTPRRRLGMSLQDAVDLVIRQRQYQCLDIAGIHVHPGSNISRYEVLLTCDFLTEAIATLQRVGMNLRYINFGGGLPCWDENIDEVKYRLGLYADLLAKTQAKAVLEPGRLIVGDAGRLVSQVTEVRERDRQMTINTAAYVIHGPCRADKHIFYRRAGSQEMVRLTVVSAKSGGCRIGGIWPAEGDSIWVQSWPRGCAVGDEIIFPHAGAYSLGFLSELDFSGLMPEINDEWSDDDSKPIHELHSTH